eukprot:TRINITY_DN731_c0_g1_i1.p1 TRINITY_DN731_c0_g1~~TRINITY_DN731_c0_g1_i1.p1  ORF type:complete len:206 (-),score=61.11 TRINITY_DN731_c0_g1_i1:364-981(-)
MIEMTAVRPFSSSSSLLGEATAKNEASLGQINEKYKDHKTTLIADVDCTADGKELCGSIGVKGYPTIKHGSPDNLQDYDGERTYKAMKRFAKKLKPSCSPSNIDFCDDTQRAEIEEVQKLSIEELDALIEADEKKLEESETTFKEAVEVLQAKYKKLMDDKDAKISAIKADGLALKKSVQSAKAKAAKAGKNAEAEKNSKVKDES